MQAAMQANVQGGLLVPATHPPAHTPASPSPLAPAPAASRCSSASGNRSRRWVSCSAGARETDLQARWEALQAELLGDPGRMNSAEFYAGKAKEEPRPISVSSRPMIPHVQKGSTCAVVLGGAEADSRRLFPLTKARTLPAIPMAGNYRLIDICLSNLVNSNIRRIYVLNQFNSKSLNSYLQHTYDLGGGFSIGGEGHVEVVSAAQGPNDNKFAEGSADVIRQWMEMWSDNSKNRFVEDILVLPSDQVYKMDFSVLMDFHRSSDADITIVCKSVEEQKVQWQGIVKLAEGARISKFVEKPSLDQHEEMSMSYEQLVDFYEESNVDSVPLEVPAAPGARIWLGSCGMYVFRTGVLQKLLAAAGSQDMGRDLIPAAVEAGLNVMAFNMAGFWADIGGSVTAFYDFHIGLARGELPFRLQQPLDTPFFHQPTTLPPTCNEGARLRSVIIGSGCTLGAGCELTDVVLGTRAVIGADCSMRGTIFMGSSFYEHERESKHPRRHSADFPPFGVGRGSTVNRAIIDKNVRIGQNVELVNKAGTQESVGQLPCGICIKDGIVVVPKNAVIHDGFKL